MLGEYPTWRTNHSLVVILESTPRAIAKNVASMLWHGIRREAASRPPAVGGLEATQNRSQKISTGSKSHLCNIAGKCFKKENWEVGRGPIFFLGVAFNNIEMGHASCPFLAVVAGGEKTTARRDEIRPPAIFAEPGRRRRGARRTGGNSAEGMDARSRGTYRLKGLLELPSASTEVSGRFMEGTLGLVGYGYRNRPEGETNANTVRIILRDKKTYLPRGTLTLYRHRERKL